MGGDNANRREEAAAEGVYTKHADLRTYMRRTFPPSSPVSAPAASQLHPRHKDPRTTSDSAARQISTDALLLDRRSGGRTARRSRAASAPSPGRCDWTLRREKLANSRQWRRTSAGLSASHQPASQPPLSFPQTGLRPSISALGSRAETEPARPKGIPTRPTPRLPSPRQRSFR